MAVFLPTEEKRRSLFVLHFFGNFNAFLLVLALLHIWGHLVPTQRVSKAVVCLRNLFTCSGSIQIPNARERLGLKMAVSTVGSGKLRKKSFRVQSSTVR